MTTNQSVFTPATRGDLVQLAESGESGRFGVIARALLELGLLKDRATCEPITHKDCPTPHECLRDGCKATASAPERNS